MKKEVRAFYIVHLYYKYDVKKVVKYSYDYWTCKIDTRTRVVIETTQPSGMKQFCLLVEVI